MKRMALALGLTALLVAISGCGTPATDLKLSKNALTAATLNKGHDCQTVFPKQVGYTWNYDVILAPTEDPNDEMPGTFTSVITKVDQDGCKTTLELKEEDSYVYGVRFPIIEMDEQAVTLRGVTFLGPLSDEAEGNTIDFLHLPLQVGAKWDDGQWTARVIGQEKVTVPAGTFDAWKIDVIGTYNQAYTAVGYYWIAPGTGIVKSSLNLDGYVAEVSLASAGVKAKRK